MEAEVRKNLLDPSRYHLIVANQRKYELYKERIRNVKTSIPKQIELPENRLKEVGQTFNKRERRKIMKGNDIILENLQRIDNRPPCSDFRMEVGDGGKASQRRREERRERAQDKIERENERMNENILKVSSTIPPQSKLK